MAVTRPSLRSKAKPLLSFFITHRSLSYLSLQTLTLSQHPSPDLVNTISRILSDHRNPHHDLHSHLSPFTTQISTSLVEQVLKRCKTLGFSAHRFFLWAKTIQGFEHTVQSYQLLIEILCGSKQFALLWDFLIELRDVENFKVTPEIFWLIFRGYCRADLPGDAIRAFDRMGEFGLKCSAIDLEMLLYELCKRKFGKDAYRLFERVKFGFEARLKSYSILVRGLGDIGEVELARKVFDEMIERGCIADVLAYNSLLEALCKGGKVDEGYEVLREMGMKGVEPDACSYSVFIRLCCEKDDIDGAFRMLDRMRRHDLFPNVFTCNGIIKKLCKNEKVDDAYELLNEMMHRGVSPDAWSYNAILAYHCEHCEVNRATKLISRMAKDGCLPDKHSYNMVLKLLVRVGRFDRATDVWESMEGRGFYPSVSTYSVMVHGLCRKKGKLEEALKYFEMMIDEGIPPYSTTVEMLRNKLVGLGMLDNVEILAGKMERSSSSSIQDSATLMRGNRTSLGSSEDTELESE